MQKYLSAEFFLDGRPNGGTAVLLRTIWITIIFFLLALLLKQAWLWLETGKFCSNEHPVKGTLPWLGAIFAATYAALYSRFSSQWTYLASTYNQIVNAIASLSTEMTPDQERTFAHWKAGFIEDAEDLHLSTKAMFLPAIESWLQDDKVREAYLKSTLGSVKRLTKLEERISTAKSKLLRNYQ